MEREYLVKRPRGIAVVGMDEYKGKIEGVDGWISNANKADGKYGYIIERVNNGLYLHTTLPDNRRTGFITNCNPSDEMSALQALVSLEFGDHAIGLDWYDIVECIMPAATYFTQTFTLDTCISDVAEWFKMISTKTDLHRNCVLLADGYLSLFEINEIADVLCEFVGEENKFLFQLAQSQGDLVQVSIWLKNDGQIV